MKPGCGAAGPALGSWGYGYTGCTGMPVIGISWPSWGPRTSIQSPASMGSHLLRPGRPCCLCSQTLLGRVQQGACGWSPLVSLGSAVCSLRGFQRPPGPESTAWGTSYLGKEMAAVGLDSCSLAELPPTGVPPH